MKTVSINAVGRRGIRRAPAVSFSAKNLKWITTVLFWYLSLVKANPFCGTRKSIALDKRIL